MVDSFQDGEFISNPVWSGQTDNFQITDGQLNTNGSGSDEIYLSTPSVIIDNTSWEFYLKINGSSPSGSNRMRIYLASDRSDLEGAVDGYYIQIGQTGDDFISLYRSDGGSGTLLASGAVVFDNEVRIRVRRDYLGNWTILSDHSGQSNFTVEFTVADNTYSTSNFFGWVVNHTSSRVDDFFLDEISVDQVRIENIAVQDQLAIEVTFNQALNGADASMIGNYSIGNLIIQSVQQNPSNEAMVTINLSPSTPLKNQEYTLLVSANLTKNQTVSKAFSYRVLSAGNVITLDDKTLSILFNDTVERNSAQTSSNYSVDNGVGSAVASLLSDDDKKVTVTFENSFTQEVNYLLSISNINNKANNSLLVDTTIQFNYVVPLLLEKGEVLSNQSLLVDFNKPLNTATATDVSNYVVDGEIGSPINAAIQLDKSQVLLTFQNRFSDQNYQLTVSNVTDTEGNIIVTSANSFAFTYQTLSIVDINQVSDNSIRVVFNQELDKISAESVNNYEILESVTILNVTLDESELNQVMITASGLRNSDYSIAVEGLLNASKNATAEGLSSNFTFEVASTFREIVINEVMADFTVPTGNTPTAYSGEFVELYNPGSHTIRLEGFLLNSKQLPAYALASEEYVLIVDNSSEAAYSSISNLIVINDFDALSTPRDSVILRDQFKNVVDSIYYDDNWFDDNDKADGGYSLEQINPELSCSEDNNWTATKDNSGGTPAVVNSVFSLVSDDLAPALREFEIIGFDSIYLKFNEPIDEATLSTMGFTIDGLNPMAISYVSYTEIYLILDRPLNSEQFYTLSIQNIYDCNGNAILPTTREFYFDKKAPVLVSVRPIAFDVVALIFDEPIEESPAERESNFLLNNAVEPRSAIRQDSAINRVHLTFESDFAAGEYTIQVNNMEDTLGNTLSTTEEFTFADQFDTILVVASRIIEVDFSEFLGKSSALLTHNYSLDGSQNPLEVLFDQIDSSKVILAFPNDFRENRALTLYVQNLKDREGNPMITPAKTFVYDTRAPSIVSVFALNDSILTINFDENIDTLVASSATNYLLNDQIFPSTITFPERDKIQLEFKTKLDIEVALKLSVKNIADLFGNAFTSTRNNTFIYDPLPPRVLGVLPISTNAIRISLNEKLDYTLANNLSAYLLDGLSPSDLSVLGPDSLNYTLSFDDVRSEEKLELMINALTDQFDNTGTNYSIQVNTISPSVRQTTFLSDTSLAITFSQPMDGLAHLINYNTNGFSLDSIYAISTDSVILFSLSAFDHNDTLNLELSALKSTTDLVLQNPSQESIFDTYFQEITFLDNQTIQIGTSTNFSHLSKSIFQLNGISPSLSTLGGEEDEKIVLYFDQSIEENVSLNLSNTYFRDTYSRLIPAQTTTVKNDTQSPEIDTVRADFFNVISIEFSEKIDAISASSLPNYGLLGFGSPIAQELVTDSTINLTFAVDLEEGKEYSLRIKNVADQAGNFLLDDTISFEYKLPTLPARGEVIITEIMADPTPVLGLPEVEFVEIHNLSDKTFDLRVLTLSDPSLTVRLPQREILPGEYVVLVSNNHVDKFSSDRVVGISPFPSLGNSGDSLRLATITAIIVDEVNYSSDWYKDNLKDDGGYSLELINPEPTCPEFLNWAASNSPDGGTPGAENSIYSLMPDVEAPRISQYELKEDTLVIIFNEYMDSLSVINIVFDGYDFSSVHFDPALNLATLIFDRPVERNESYDLTLSEAKDCSGNVMEPFHVALGDGYIPVFGEVIFTEIMADPTPAIGLPEAEYLEIYNASDKSFDLDVLLISDPTRRISLPSRLVEPGEYIAIVPSSSEALFEGTNSIGVPSLPSLGNTFDSLVLSNKYDELVNEVNYTREWYRDTDKDDGGYSLELINPLSPCSGQANWIASASDRGGTPGSENAVFSLELDSLAPFIIDQQLISDRILRLIFNEDLDTSSIQTVNFTGTTFEEIIISPQNAAFIDLILSEEVVFGKRFELSISGISDCSGNVMSPTTLSFGKGRVPQFHEVLITEMMADPDPPIELPAAEFFELQNMTTDLISLAEVTLIVGDDSVQLSTIVLAPTERTILCPNSAVAAFSEFGTAHGVTGWISISNSEDYVGLVLHDQIVFDVNYTADWYEEEVDGGVSLEMKDTSNPCATSSNWSASTDVRGGTPAGSNSNSISLPDNFGPILIGLDFSSQNTIQAVFNERLSPDNLENVTVEISPLSEITTVSFETLSRSEVIVEMAANFNQNQTYNVQIGNIEDCNGNISDLESTFIYPSEDVDGGLIINEILFNPRDDGVDYVEIFNTTDEYINLKDWRLGRIQDNEISQSAIISLTNLVLKPRGYLALTTNPNAVVTQYPQSSLITMHKMSSMPTYPNTEGIVALIDQNANILDNFSYDEDYHSTLLEDEDGVSLERISFENVTNDPNNWTSASSLVDFGTPGYENSQTLNGESIAGKLTIEPKIFVPGLNGSVALQSFTTINYILSSPGMFANVTIYNQNGQFIRSLASGASLLTEGFLRWDGSNEAGNTVRMGYYIVVFELYDGSGNKEILRETVVVGR